MNNLLLGTFVVMSLLFAIKRYYHLEYLKITDKRLKHIKSLSDLISTKGDIESTRNFHFFLEIEWKLMLPVFKIKDQSEQSLLAKKYADYVKIVLIGLYLVALALIIEIIFLNG